MNDTIKIKENNKKIIIILIFIIAIVARIYLWPNAIDDINCDEAMTAINAKDILTNDSKYEIKEFRQYYTITLK